MKILELLESYFRGWLPKTTDFRPSIKLVNPKFTQISKLLSIVGTILIALFCYSTLLVLYNVNLNLSVSWLFLIAYIVGIGIAIFGFTLQIPSNNTIGGKSQYLSGLVFLTVGVLGFIFAELVGAFNVTYPFSVHSLFLKLFIYWKAGWVNQVFSVLSVLGAILILLADANSRPSMPENREIRSSKSHYLLLMGAIILSSGLLLQALSLISGSFFSAIQQFFTIFYGYIYSLGVLCITLAWVINATSSLHRKPLLLPTIYIISVAVLVSLFLIPIN